MEIVVLEVLLLDDFEINENEEEQICFNDCITHHLKIQKNLINYLCIIIQMNIMMVG